MSTLSDSMLSASGRALPLKKRPDLTAEPQRYQGKKYWVLKEPVGLTYYRFQEEEYAILQMLDGRTSLDEIKERFEKEFAPQKIELVDLQRFLGMLHRSNLVVSNIPGQGPQLKRRRDQKRRQEWIGLLSNVLAIRIRGFDPERFLTRLYPYVRWLFSVPAFLVCCTLGLTALVLIAVQFDVFVARLPSFYQFFGPKNWLLLALTLGVTKILHELGHGLACKHWGGECHEMGVMFLVLTPCLYCNVSDSWMLPSKWRRAAIGAAGMYVELSLASIATLLWWFSEPGGTLNSLCLRVMFISSVSTLLFNGNPLLRYDGYYILADLVEIPNLRQKATSITQRILTHWCLGIEPQEDPFLPKRNHLFFALYTVASIVYRWFVVLSIFLFLNHVFEPYGLKIIGQVIAAAGIFGLVVMPLWKLGKFFYLPGRVDQVKWPRVYATVGVVAAVIAAIVFLPLPYYVRGAVQLRPRDPKTVYVRVAGQLEEVYVEPGQHVEAYDPKDQEADSHKKGWLARLSNLDLDLEEQRLIAQRDKYRQQLKNLQQQQFLDPTVSSQLPQIEEILATIRNQLERKREERDKLLLTSPSAGMVLPPPLRPPRPKTESVLPSWSGSPLEEKNLGTHLDESDLFCQVADPRKLEALIVIDQADIELVRVGEHVAIKLDSLPDRTFTNRIEEISKVEMKATPPDISTQAGGDVPTKTDPSGVQRPQSTSYQARSGTIDNSDGLLQVGLRGRARIFAGYRPLWFRIWRYLATTFHFRL